MKELLKVLNLTVEFNNRKVVSDISFSLEKGEIMAIVGMSGSGKSQTCLAMCGLLSDEAKKSGNVWFDNASGHAECGKDISIIFQDPRESLNPLMKVGKQIDEALKLHEKLDKEERKRRVIQMLKEVELPEAEKIYDMYPHNLSGGMCQRVMIAMALIVNPQIMIADEPTASLDTSTSAEIIKLIMKLNKEKNISIIMVSHDLSLVKRMSRHVVVMKDGVIVESGITSNVFEHPVHEYTKQLIGAMIHKNRNDELIENENILEVEDLSLFYGNGKKKKYVKKGISFTMKKGEILGIQGRSGCGKTTLGRTILGLHTQYEGHFKLNAKSTQMIFQDHAGALNPVKRIKWILEEPLRIKNVNDNEIEAKINEVLSVVGLSSDYLNRRPKQLSGGQRQRIIIALAIIAGNDFIVADEPLSALDVNIKSQIEELLLRLRKEFGLSILFISHDPAVMERMCDRVIVWENI